MDLTIIIPVYNTLPNALHKCFESIRTLSGISFEVLIIDDGSDTMTKKYCMDYADNDNSFIYVHQNNARVSTARNLGIKLSKGTYIMFVDSDDEIIAKPINDLIPNIWGGIIMMLLFLIAIL